MFGFGRKSKKIEPPLQAGLPVGKVDRETALRQLIDSNFSDCVKAYANAESGSTLEKLAFEKIKKTGRTFDDWLTVYIAVAVTPAGIYAFEKMMATAKSFSEWKKIREYNLDTSTAQMLLDKLAPLAKMREELMYIYNISLEGSSARMMMENALKAQAKTVEDWDAIADSSSGEMREFAVDRMIELTVDDIDDLNDLLSADIISGNVRFKAKVLDKVRVLTLSSDKWLEVLADENMDNEVKEIALEKLIADPALASRSLADWEKLFDEAEEGSDFEKHAALMVIDKADPNDPDAIASLANSNTIENDQGLFNKIVEKLRIVAAPFGKWKEAYENFDDSGVGSSSSKIVSIVFLRMIESITNVEELIEADEAIDDDNHTDDTKEKFEAKAKSILITEQACQSIIDGYYADDDLFEIAGEWMIASAKTTEECIDVFFSVWEDWKDDGDNVNDELVTKAIDHLVEVATDSELYILSKFPENDFGNLAETASNVLTLRQKKV